MKIITTILSIIAIGLVMFTIVNLVYANSMEAHCTKLQQQAIDHRDNPHYYVTSIDYQECKEVHGIEINARIK